MKKILISFFLMIGLSMLLSSCYVYHMQVGKGSQTGVEVRKMNHYLIGGLIPLKTSNPKEMSGNAENYDITIKHSFGDLLLSGITWGIYSPTVTIIKK